jgi:hypothetical protein
LEDLPDQNMNITVDVVNTENEIVDTWNIFHGVDAAWVSSFAEHKLFKLNESVGAAAGFAFEVQARCAFFGRNLHSRMPLDPTHVRLKRTRV